MASDHNGRLSGLQAARAIAALMVVVHHTTKASRFSPTAPIVPDWLTTAGAAGVDIFFVVSGFIMMVVSFPPGQGPDNPWSFLRKRIARIYPLYWIAAALVLAGWQLGYFWTFEARNPTAEDIIRSLLLAPTDVLVVEVSWTLVYEMNFYILFALLLWARSPLGCLLGVTGLLLLQLMLARYAPDEAVSDFLSNPIVLEFCFGLGLGYAYLRGVLPKHFPWVAPAAAFLVMVVAPLLIADEEIGGLDSQVRVWAWGLPAVVLVAACINWSIAHGVMRRTWILLGDASYAIYLLHPFVVLVYKKAVISGALQHAPEVALVIATTLLSAAFGVAAHFVVERPVTKAARRLLLPEPPRATVLT